MRARLFAWCCATLFFACGQKSPPDQPPPDASAGTTSTTGSGGAAGSSGNAGGAGGAAGSGFTRECGGEACASTVDCCTEDAACGYLVPEEVFVVSCVGATHQGGMLSSECDDHPNESPPGSSPSEAAAYNDFLGCRRQDGTCGYWVEEVRFSGAGEVTISKLNFGCVDVALFKMP